MKLVIFGGIFICATLLIGKLISVAFGLPPWIGELIAIAIAYGAVAVLIWWLRKNFFPQCGCGRSRMKDFERLGPSADLDIAEPGLVWKCRCGQRYLMRGPDCFKIKGDGQVKKYSVKPKRLGKWMPCAEN